GQGVTAADILNTWPDARLAGTFADLADEPRARRLARAIVRRRATAPFATSDDLVNAIREARGPRSGPSDFARLFQALRIVVNQELEQLERALPALRAARELADLRARRANLDGHRADLERRIRAAESRAVLVPRAQARLGLHLPSDSEIVLVPAPSGSR